MSSIRIQSGSPPTLWCVLIFAARARAALNHIGVQRALRQVAALPNRVGMLLEYAHELLADDLALLFGVNDALQAL
jgi:hypothetical protein